MSSYAQQVLAQLGHTVSTEDNTVDPNTDNNPIVNSDTTPEEVDADEFTLDEQPEVEKDNIGVDGHDIDTVIKEETKAVDNDKQLTGTTIKAMNALDTIAVEMMQVVAENGKLSYSEIYVANESLKIFGCAPVEISLENINTDSMLRIGTDVTLEGITSGIVTLINNFGNAIERTILAAAGICAKLTPFIDKKLSAANELRGQLDNSNREDGLKELSGKWVTSLAVDSKIPEPKTVIETLKTMNQANAEIVNDQVFKEVIRLVKGGVEEIKRVATADFAGYDKPSGWLTLAIAFVGLAAFNPASAGVGIGAAAIAGSKMVLDQYKIGSQIKLGDDVMPDTRKLFPTSAKVLSTEEPTFTIHRSLPLFGNKAYFTAGMKPLIKIGEEGVSANDFGAYVDVQQIERTVAPKDRTIRALTSNEQKEVLDMVIAGLSNTRNWYKTYPQRSKAFTGLISEVSKIAKDMHKPARAESKSYSGYIMRGILHGTARSCAEGIWYGQSKIVTYSVKTYGSLLTYVQESAKLSQLNTSNESYSIEGDLDYEDNPFL